MQSSIGLSVYSKITRLFAEIGLAGKWKADQESEICLKKGKNQTNCSTIYPWNIQFMIDCRIFTIFVEAVKMVSI